MKKEIILDTFDTYVVNGVESNIINLLNNNKFTISDKIMIVDIFISYKLYKLNNFKFNVHDCFEEIFNLNKNIFVIIDDNGIYFNNILSSITNIVNNKKFKTNFNLSLYGIEPIVYFIIIVKSLHYIGFNNTLDDFCLNNGMLHRNVVISNLKQNIEAYMYLNLNTAIKKNTIKIIMLLNKDNLIESKKISKIEGKKLKSYILLKLNIEQKFNYKDRLYLNYSRVKFKYTEDYLIGASHLTICKFMKKSLWQLIENPINPNAIIKLASQAICIDFSDWDYIQKNVIDSIKKKNINFQLSTDINDVIDELILLKSKQNNFINDIKNKYYKNQKNSVSNKNLYSNITDLNQQIEFIKLNLLVPNITDITPELEQDTDFFKENFFNNEILAKLEYDILNLNNIIQWLHYIAIAEKAKDIIYPIYLPYYYDFRGRIYPRSAMGFTYMKLIRPLFTIISQYTQNYENLRASKYFNIINNSKIDIRQLKLVNEISDINKYYTIIHLLEIGKHYKSCIITDRGLNLQELVDLGIKYFYSEENSLELEDSIYVRNLKNNLTNFIKTNNYLNISIIRDSTASFLQHWGIKLGVKTEFLEKLNLNGNIWYDTYILVISIFVFKNSKYQADKFKLLLKRKILKNFIMIVNYNAGRNKCYENLKFILYDNNIIFDDKELKLFCNDFHAFLKNDLFNYLFLRSKDVYLEKINNTLICEDNSIINLIYLEYNEIKEDIKIQDCRWIIIKRILIDKSCSWKTKVTTNANIIQASDAELARYIINQMPVLTVHDSFSVSLFEVHKLMDITNLYFNKKMNCDLYSLFILI